MRGNGRGPWLGDLATTDLAGCGVVLVPVGSCEQHGPHLPLDTDTRIAVEVAIRAAGRVDPSGRAVAVAPPIAVGASGEHHGFAGTLSIGTDALRTVIVELVRSADWAEHVVFVNGHGGNAGAMKAALDELRHEGRSAHGWWPVVPAGDAHAGRTETSIMLAIDPSVVRLDRAEAGNTSPLSVLAPRLRASGVRAVSANGVLGDPRGASAVEGEAILDDLTADLVTMVSALCSR